MSKNDVRTSRLLSFLQSFLPFLGRKSAVTFRKMPRNKRRHRPHRGLRHTTPPPFPVDDYLPVNRKSRGDVDALLRSVDLDALLGKESLAPSSVTMEAESAPVVEQPEANAEPACSPDDDAANRFLAMPRIGETRELLQSVDLDAMLGNIGGQVPSAQAAVEEPAAPQPSGPELRGGVTRLLAEFWRLVAPWHRVPARKAPPPAPAAPADSRAYLEVPIGAPPPIPSNAQETTMPASRQGAMLAESPSSSGRQGEFLRPMGEKFIRKEETIPQLDPHEQRKQEELRKRQREDEEALREQAERRRKEEEERRKLAQEAAKGPQEPVFKSPKRISLHGRENIFVGIINAIRHFGLGKERFQIIQNLATMLNAGLPLIDSLRTLQMETHNRQARGLIQRIVERVESGSTLWRAMEQEHFFAPDALALVRIGEEAGNLAENMQYLADQQEKDAALSGKVKMAMIYPSIVMVLMFVIVIGLGMFVLPNLIGVLTSLNVPLPLVTRAVIGFTKLFSEYGTIVLPSVIVGSVVFAILVKYTPLQAAFQWVVFHIPGIGSLLWEATIARFGVIVGGLLQAGVPLVEALRSLVDVTTILSYRRFYQRLLDHILLGDSFSKSFAAIRGSDKLLPLSVQQLVMTGERTGSLSKVMLKIADIYEKKANDTAQKLPVILEPMLLLFIGALVGTIAFAIIVPIYSIVGSVNK